MSTVLRSPVTGETNFGSAMQVDLKLPADVATFQLFTDCWKEMLPTACPATSLLTKPMLSDLVRD
jgi:hypothetical protein